VDNHFEVHGQNCWHCDSDTGEEAAGPAPGCFFGRAPYHEKGVRYVFHKNRFFCLSICISCYTYTSRLKSNAQLSTLRKQLWRDHQTLSRTLRQLQRSEPMVPGSFYLLRRKCGKPNCRCARGQLHARWVITRSEQGKDRLYSVAPKERARLRKLTGEYRRWQRARAVLVKRQQKILQTVDQLGDERIEPWPLP
jgi:hypothetical protein